MPAQPASVAQQATADVLPWRPQQMATALSIPDAFDWRDQGVVSRARQAQQGVGGWQRHPRSSLSLRPRHAAPPAVTPLPLPSPPTRCRR